MSMLNNVMGYWSYIRGGGAYIGGGGAYIWNEVSVSICGGLIFGGLIVRGLWYAKCIKALFTLYRITFHTGLMFTLSLK